MRYADPDYLVYDDRYAGIKFHNIDELLDHEHQPLHDILKPVYVTYQPMKLVVYEYTGPN
ncbi:MAG: hypothetical protein JSW58_12065 [Candidatus Latescibacterota bacterium]|nr:MAG: hypothetical protein JSW58_12065 [Candidatus Latescibacterota bacterium]